MAESGAQEEAQGAAPAELWRRPRLPPSRLLPCWTRCPLGLHNSSKINPSGLPSASSS